jgi:hypothetical protein
MTAAVRAINPFYGYAFLKVSYDHFNLRNPLDLLKPVIHHHIRSDHPHIIDLERVQSQVAASWGLHVPVTVIRFVLSRLRKDGVVEFDRSQRRWIGVLNKERNDQLIAAEDSARSTYNRCLSRIQDALVHERDNGSDHDEVLAKFLDSSPASMFWEGLPLTHPDRIDDLVIRVIVRSLGLLHGKPNIQAIDDLAAIAAGDMLFHAIASVSEWEATGPGPTDPMKDVAVYLDTGILFRALGWLDRFGESTFQSGTREILEMARRTGCQLRAFDHTVEEMKEALYAISARLYSTSGAFGPMLDHIITHGLSPSDLVERAGDLEHGLKEIRVDMVESPPYRPEITIDEKALEWQIEVDVKQESFRARLRDVESLSAIVRLRSAEPKFYLERCDALFLTANGSLARAAARYFREFFPKGMKRNSVPIAVTEPVLASRLWVKLPTEFPDVARKQVITHALSNIRLRKGLQERFVEYLRRFVEEGRISDTAAARVALSRLANQLASIEAHNDAKALDEQIVDDIVHRVLAEEKRIRLDLVMSTTDKLEGEYGAKLSEMETRMLTATGEAKKYEEAILALRRENEDLRAALRLSQPIAASLAGVLTKACIAGTVIILVLAGFRLTDVPLLLEGTVAVVSGILTAVGASYFTVGRYLEKRMAERLRGVLLALLERQRRKQV